MGDDLKTIVERVQLLSPKDGDVVLVRAARTLNPGEYELLRECIGDSFGPAKVLILDGVDVVVKSDGEVKLD